MKKICQVIWRSICPDCCIVKRLVREMQNRVQYIAGFKGHAENILGQQEVSLLNGS